ncbi:putative ribonuclease H-like domain-containing protein [Tanacetum coccineum]|uniref:Ribonuclease H-like domain-containing protein n=1 Tax=Tanacetum coccineum TaxID=301880 RepID=A0ABQ5AI71_9ASTR
MLMSSYGELAVSMDPLGLVCNPVMVGLLAASGVRHILIRDRSECLPSDISSSRLPKICSNRGLRVSVNGSVGKYRISILSNMRMTTGESIALEIQFDLTVELLPRVKLGSWRSLVAEILKKLTVAIVKTAKSMIGSLMYVTASRPDIMFAVCACSRFQVTPKTSHLSAVKRIFRYLKGKPKLGLWYPRVSSFDLESYSDSDYAGANLDRKSTTGGCQFLGRRLITWQCKKQTIVATSTTEAEYVAAASCCGQVLWIQNQMLDYGFNFMNTKIYIDNESTICIVKNPVYHSKTKHIAIRHHFIRDAYEKKLIQVLKIHTNDNVADLLTKAFDVSRFHGSSVDERGKTHHGKSNLFQETPKPSCSTFLPTDVKHCLNVGYTFVNFKTSEAVWKSHVCITRKSWPLFKSKTIAQVVHAWIKSKNSLVKHFEDMRLCRPSKEYLQVWFDPPSDESMSCLTTKGMRNNGAIIPDTYIVHSLFGQTLISLTDDLSLLSNMAALESCPKHNMIAYLEKTKGNVEFHEIIDFLRRSHIYHALTISPVVSTTFVEQFWTSIKSKTINNVRHITAKVAGKSVCISEASIRTDLIFDDADRIDSLPNQAIFDAIQIMGYEGDLTVLTFNKALFSPQLRILANISVPLDHFPVNSLTNKVFSFMIKKGKHFSGKVTPLFDTMLVQPTQDEGASSERLSDEPPTPSPAPTSEVPNESLPDSFSAQPSEIPFEQQHDPSLRPSPRTSTNPSPTPVVHDSIPEPTGENLGDHSSNDTSLLGNEDDMTLHNVYDICLSLCKQQRFPRNSYSKKHRVHKESVSKQGRKKAKGESSVQRDPMFDVMPEDKIDHMETENAQSKVRTNELVDEDKELDEVRLSTEEGVSTDFEKVSTDRPIVNDETIATLLINMSKAKAASKEKEKGVELKDVEEIDRPRPTSTRSILTLKPLPKIDPKDKGKKKIEEEDESESEDDDIPQAVKKFKQVKSDEEMARKIQEEWEAEEQEREQFTIEERAKFLHDTIVAQRKFLAQQRSEAIRNRPPTKNQLRNQMMTYLKHVGNFKHSELKSKKFEDIQAMYEKIKRSDEDFIAIGSVEDDRLITKMNKKDSSKEEEIKQESKEEVKEEDEGEEKSRKRKHGTRKKMKSRKRRFKQDTSEDDPSDIEKENEELRLCLTIATDEDKEVDYEILDKKFPIIDWKTENLGTKPQFDESKRSEEINMNVVTRSNGQNRSFSTLIRVLSVFDREDLDAIYKLVMNIYQDKIPEGFDKVLWLKKD